MLWPKTYKNQTFLAITLGPLHSKIKDVTVQTNNNKRAKFQKTQQNFLI